jgi:hypothetical protein
MNIYKTSAKELDERLELDKRRDNRAFGIVYDSLEEAPEGFYDLQRNISDGLQKEFRANFDDGVDRSKLKSWQMWRHNFFCFNGDMFGSERIVIEMTKEILGDKLLGLIMSYLEKCSSRYSVIAAVYNGKIEGDKYLGRFVINLDEIAVEESLADTWSQQVKFMEIENLQNQQTGT